MELKRHGAGSAVYDYPVELVWRSIASDKQTIIEPIDEEKFNAEPPENMIYTRALEIRTNECFSMQMKSRRFDATWRFTLSSLAPCRTRLSAETTVEYRDFKTYLLAGMGGGLRGEVRSFFRDIGERLKQNERMK